MQRLKITVACEACRRRKSKCSGSAPCTSCQKAELFCEFRTSRQRRGPRPKAAGPSLQDNELPTIPIITSEELGRHGTPNPAADPSYSADTETMAMWSSCREDLQAIVDTKEFIARLGRHVEEDVLLDLLCHLLEVFWTHAHSQQLPILNPRILYQSIKARECPDYLCLAISAGSCRFSCHQILKQDSGPVRLDECFAAMARRSLHELEMDNLTRIQALCILIQYDAATGRGNQAWADSAFALAVVDAMMDLQRPSAEFYYNEVEMARAFLMMHRHLHALGYPSLSVPYGTRSSFNNGDEVESSRAWALLRMLRTAHEYAEFNQPEGCLPPWHSESTFQKLCRELENFRLRNPDEVQPEISSYEDVTSPSNALTVTLLSSLKWHCAVIILHRHLLAHASSWAPYKPAGTPHGAPIPSLFSTPSSSFVKEHIKIGLSSADAVVDLCGQVMRCEVFLLPPFLAYTCFQSAVFLINLLRCGLPDGGGKLQQVLRVNIVIITMTREFYRPACAWIKTLEELSAAPYVASTESTAGSHCTYLIEEPGFVLFDTPCSRNKSTTSPMPQRDSSFQKAASNTRPTSQAADGANQLNSLLDYQDMLEDFEDSSMEPTAINNRGATAGQNQSPVSPIGRLSRKPSENATGEGFQPPPNDVVHGLLDTGSPAQATMLIPQENSFINSLPSEDIWCDASGLTNLEELEVLFFGGLPGHRVEAGELEGLQPERSLFPPS